VPRCAPTGYEPPPAAAGSVVAHGAADLRTARGLAAVVAGAAGELGGGVRPEQELPLRAAPRDR
jgi:hypothetical protein